MAYKIGAANYHRQYRIENQESLSQKAKARRLANLEEHRKKGRERARIAWLLKKEAKLADSVHQELLAERAAHKASLPKRRAEWIAAAKLNRKTRAASSQEEKAPPHQRKYRRGFVREDGMVFWRYQWDQLEKEKWVTPEYYQEKAPIERERALARAAASPSKPNRENVNLRHRWYNENDPLFALKHRCRARIQAAVRLGGWKKPCKTSEMLGCDWTTLKLHIESQFEKGMNWDNRKKWHIDHFHPLADAKTLDEVIRLSHYTNLRPMWAKANHTKWKHLPTTGHQIPLLLQ